MTIEKRTLDKVRDKLHSCMLIVLEDAKNGSSFAAKYAHWHIMTADEAIAKWYDADIDRADIAGVCFDLDEAIAALSHYAEEYADMLIVTRYRLEREVMT